jgi:perosamine synthetase
MAPLEALAAQHGIAIVEDAAQAHGLTYDGRPCGSFGVASTFSFYSNKLITTGEGGMVVTDDDRIAERSRSMRNLCFVPERRFVHDELGWNFRLSNLQAALGVAQLERFDALVERKRRMGARYQELLRDVPRIELPLTRTPHAENVYWVFGVVLDETLPFDAAEAMRRLGGAGVGTRPFFWPMHEQPVLRARGLFTGESHPVSERLARRGLYLPSGLGLRADEQERVAACLRNVVSGEAA